MQFQYSHRRDEKEAIFFSVENGQTTTIVKGSLCAWDMTNPTVGGVSINTRGTRVVVYPTGESAIVVDGLRRQAGFAHTDMEGTAASTLGTQSYLIQVYGWRNDLRANTTTGSSDIIAGGYIVPSTDAAGTVCGPLTSATPSLTETAKCVGTSCQVVATPIVQAFEGIVNTLR
jgi:hypothetical protein